MSLRLRGGWAARFIVAAALGVGCTTVPNGAGPEAAPGELAALATILLDETDTRDPEKRLAAHRLGRLGAEAADPLRTALTRERDPVSRAAIVGALGRVLGAACKDDLVRAMADPHPLVRASAIGVLGTLISLDPSVAGVLEAKVREGGEDGRLAFGALATAGQLPPTVPPVSLRSRGPGSLAPSGRVFYVDASSGDDGGEGSERKPYRSFQRGVAALHAGSGDRLLVTAGVDGRAFYEEVEIGAEQGGVPGLPTVIGAWPGHPPPVLDGAVEGAPDRPGKGIGLHVVAPWVTLEGLTVQHYVESGIHINGVEGGVISHCTALRCERHGLFVYYAAGATILEPTVRDCANQGISIRSSPRAVVLGGTTVNNGIDGLLLLQDSDDAVIDGLSSRDNRRGIALIEGSDGARISRVDLRGNREGDLVIAPDCGAVLLPGLAAAP